MALFEKLGQKSFPPSVSLKEIHSPQGRNPFLDLPTK